MDLMSAGHVIQGLEKQTLTAPLGGGVCKPVGGEQALLPLPGVVWTEPQER